jgi:hypothetical protein
VRPRWCVLLVIVVLPQLSAVRYTRKCIRRSRAVRTSASAAATAEASRSWIRPSPTCAVNSPSSRTRSRRVGVAGTPTSTRRSTTSTAQRPDAAARPCSQARRRQPTEHHFGMGPRDRGVIASPHQAHDAAAARRVPPSEDPRGDASDPADASLLPLRATRCRRCRSASCRRALYPALLPAAMSSASGTTSWKLVRRIGSRLVQEVCASSSRSPPACCGAADVRAHRLWLHRQEAHSIGRAQRLARSWPTGCGSSWPITPSPSVSVRPPSSTPGCRTGPDRPGTRCCRCSVSSAGARNASVSVPHHAARPSVRDGWEAVDTAGPRCHDAFSEPTVLPVRRVVDAEAWPREGGGRIGPSAQHQAARSSAAARCGGACPVE